MRPLLALLGLAFLVAVAWGQTPNDLFRQGKEVFKENCAQCHRANGQGLPGTFPALDGDPFVVAQPQAVIATVLNGRKGNLGQMPTWKDKLDDPQIAAVVTYIRHAWSNRAPAVTPAMVSAIRAND